MFHLRFGLSDHLKALLDFVFGSRRRVKKVRIFRAWFSQTMLWDINVIPNEQDNGYLMLPPGVLHMSALGRFGRFTLFSPRVSPSKHLPCSFCFVLCFGFGVFVALLCFCFLFCKCFGIPNSPRSLDLDDRQGLIASSAMQQKKKGLNYKDCWGGHRPEEDQVGSSKKRR